MNGVISMSMKETERISVMDNLIVKRIKQKHAAKQLGITVRQVQRVLVRYKKDGAAGLVHKNRGQSGNRSIPQKEKDKAIELVK